MKYMRRAMALLMVLLVPFIIACAKQAQQAEVEEQPAATATPLVTATPDSGSQAVTLTMPPMECQISISPLPFQVLHIRSCRR